MPAFDVLAVDGERRVLLGVFRSGSATEVETEAAAWSFAGSDSLPLAAVGDDQVPGVAVESGVWRWSPVRFGDGELRTGDWFAAFQFDADGFRAVSRELARTGGVVDVRPLDAEEVAGLEQELQEAAR